MNNVKFNRKNLLLYAVTDRAWTGRQTLLEQIEDALIGGVTMIQLREKGLAEPDFTAEAIQVRDLCRRYGVPLIINDSVNVALKSGADGVHVGIEDAPVAEIRKLAGPDFIIGATAKTVAQAAAAQAAVSIPAAAIGGITFSNMPQLRGGGMAGFAVVSAVFAAADIRSGVRALKSRAEEIIL